VEKGGKNKDRDSWKRCAWLAIAWNNIEFARDNIFNTENRFHYQVRRINTRAIECDNVDTQLIICVKICSQHMN